MNRLPAGYTRRPDGTFAKVVDFELPTGGGDTYRETLVRSPGGRLLRVERGKRALAQRER